jgi:hypothetical protein
VRALAPTPAREAPTYALRSLVGADLAPTGEAVVAPAEVFEVVTAAREVETTWGDVRPGARRELCFLDAEAGADAKCFPDLRRLVDALESGALDARS